MSFWRIAAKMSPSKSCTRSGIRGVNGGQSRSCRPARVSSARSAMPISPGISITSSSPTPSACTIVRRRSAGAAEVIVSWITSPRRRRFSAVSNSRTRSSASSSTSRSLSRSTRKAQSPSIA